MSDRSDNDLANMATGGHRATYADAPDCLVELIERIGARVFEEKVRARRSEVQAAPSEDEATRIAADNVNSIGRVHSWTGEAMTAPSAEELVKLLEEDAESHDELAVEEYGEGFHLSGDHHRQAAAFQRSAAAELRRLAGVERKYTDLETRRASCCDENEQAADAAEKNLAMARSQLSESRARVAELESGLQRIRIRVDQQHVRDIAGAQFLEAIDSIARAALTPSPKPEPER